MKRDLEREIDLLREKTIAEVMRNGGSTGSNMAEPPWVPPGPIRTPDGLPPEEIARRKRNSEEIRAALKELADESR